MILTGESVSRADFEQRTGWVIKPEGACKGDICVPLPPSDELDSGMLSERLGMPLVRDDAHGLAPLGPETLTGRALTTAVAPEVVLPDLEGNPFALSSLHGQKVLLVAWASW